MEIFKLQKFSSRRNGSLLAFMNLQWKVWTSQNKTCHRFKCVRCWISKVEFLQKCREEEVEFILSKVVSNTNSLPKAKRNKPLQGSELSSLWIDEPIRPEGFWISPVLCVVHDLIDAGHHTGALQILIHMFQSS